MEVLNPYVRSWGIATSFAQAPAARSNISRDSYASQLRAFTGAILWREPVLIGPDDAVAKMSGIDACYAAAGLQRREASR